MKKNGKIIILILVVMTVFCSFGIISGTASDADLAVPYVTATNKSDGVYVSWTMDFDAEYYNIYRKSGTEEPVKIGKTLAYVNYFTDISAVSGVNYTYTVLPCVGNTQGECESQVNITYLAQPGDITVTNKVSGVEITWSKSESATKYNIYRKLPSEKNWNHAGFAGDTESFIDTSAESGTTYFYTVRARSADAVSSYDEEGVSTTYYKAPEFTAVSATRNGISLKWEAVDGADKYIVYRKSADEEQQLLTELEADVLSYHDTAAEVNKLYTYTVCALFGKKAVSYSPETSYKYIPLVKLTSVSNALKGLEVKWEGSPYATGYKIYRKQADGAWERAGVVRSKNKNSFMDTAVSSSQTYSYTVIAVSDSFQSSFDNKGISAQYIAVPKDIDVTKSSDGYDVTWLKVEGATNYTVYRRDNEEGKWEKLSTVGKTDTYSDSSADTSRRYEYSVRASAVMPGTNIISAYSEAVGSSRINPDKKMVALTYDDGPSNSITNWILDILEENDAKATFFVIGSSVDYNSEAMVRAHNMGCEIANHTYNHIDLPSYSDSTVSSEISKTNEIIKKYTGKYPSVFRAPGGATNSRVCELVGLPIIYWTVDTRDWEHRTASTTVSSIKNNVSDGAIILMHDIYDATAEASETIIPWLIDEGYQLVTVSELMQYRGIEMQNGVTYYDAFTD